MSLGQIWLTVSVSTRALNNLGRASKSKELTVTDVGPDLEGFQRDLRGLVTDEFHQYKQMQQVSLERSGNLLGIQIDHWKVNGNNIGLHAIHVFKASNIVEC